MPPTVARLRRVAYGAQVPEFAREIVPEIERVGLTDGELEVLKVRAGNQSAACFLRDLAGGELQADVKTRFH